MTHPDATGGFSLVEALVALLVLSIAAVGLTRAVEAHVETIRGLQDRAVAGWVAENRLVELDVARIAPAAGEDEVEMLNRRFAVAVTSAPTNDPDLQAVTVVVRRAGEAGPLTRLRGFVDIGQPAAPGALAP